MPTLREIADQLDASRSASGTHFRVSGLTPSGGYAVEATDLFPGGTGVSTDGYLPEETATLFAEASERLAAFLVFARKVEEVAGRDYAMWDDPCDAMRGDITAALDELEATP